MPIEIKMPALSPTMEEGTLAKWMVKPGDKVEPGDILAEIETDKATMEFEAIDEGTVADIAVAEGTQAVKVGTVIATLTGEGEDASGAKPATKAAPADQEPVKPVAPTAKAGNAPAKASGKAEAVAPASSTSAPRQDDERIIASPLARRIAAREGIDLATVTGSGPRGRIVRADLEGADASLAVAATVSAPPAQAPAGQAPAAPADAASLPDFGIPHEDRKINNVRKVIARRLTEAKQQIPHIYLTTEVRLDQLLKLRGELNTALESRGVKLSVNDLLIKALAGALEQVPQCNVSFGGDILRHFERVDISVAVAAPTGLITPIIRDAGAKAVSAIAGEMKELAGRAREGKLQPQDYQGGTASLSNLGMYGITQFDAVVNPPQGMILAVGAGVKRPWVVDGALGVATVMSATGSFDHRAIDGADGAQLMEAFKTLVEAPLALIA